MRTVRGWVISKEPVSLKKAARIVSSFAARDIFASQDVTNYLKRAALAFNELLHFHRDLRQGRSFRPDDAAAGDGEPSARKPEAGESFGRKEPRKDKKPADVGAKAGIVSEERQVDGVSKLLVVKDSEGKGSKSIVAGEVVEVKKSAGNGRKLTMDVAVEGSIQLAVEGNGEKAHVDGGDEQKRKEKMNNTEEGDEQSKKEKKKKEEIEKHSKKEEEMRTNRLEGKEQNKIEKRKNSEAEEEHSKKKRRRRNE